MMQNDAFLGKPIYFCSEVILGLLWDWYCWSIEDLLLVGELLFWPERIDAAWTKLFWNILGVVLFGSGFL